jgi:hypothetical protein
MGLPLVFYAVFPKTAQICKKQKPQACPAVSATRKEEKNEKEENE